MDETVGVITLSLAASFPLSAVLVSHYGVHDPSEVSPPTQHTCHPCRNAFLLLLLPINTVTFISNYLTNTCTHLTKFCNANLLPEYRQSADSNGVYLKNNNLEALVWLHTHNLQYVQKKVKVVMIHEDEVKTDQT